MLNSQILLIGLALAMDAAAVSFSLGLMSSHESKVERTRRGIFASLTFAFFQFFMTWLGSIGGYFFSFSQYGYLYQILVAGIFILIGLHCIMESFEEEKKITDWGVLTLLSLAVATSIDALGAGLSFGTMPRIYLIALDIGVITFIVCGIFFLLSQFLKSIPEKWLFRLAGFIFLVIGGSTIWSTIFKEIL